MQGLGNAAVLGKGLSQTGGVAIPAQHPHEVVGPYRPCGERPGYPEHVGPALHDPGEVHPVTGERVEGAVVGAGVGPPEPGVGEVGDAGGDGLPVVREQKRTLRGPTEPA